MTEKELSFVWGAPLSGQRRWMMRSAELAPVQLLQSLCFTDSDQTFESMVSQIEKIIEEQAEGVIQVEWPSHLLCQDIELESWLSKHKDWNPSFTAVLLEEGELLNKHYSDLYEELARATLSSVVIARSAFHKNEALPWIGPEGLDFGKRLRVFEDDLWPEPKFELPPINLQAFKNYDEEYQELSIPVVAEISDYFLEKIFEELSTHDFGQFWGMEYLKQDRSAEGKKTFELYTLTPQNFYQTRSTLSSKTKVYGFSEGAGFIRMAGVGLKTTSIREYLGANELIQEA